ncbi:MAG: DUF6503 family protein [Puniceicoccales bacterium]
MKTTLSTLLLIGLSAAIAHAGQESSSIDEQVSQTQSAHNLQSWWGKDLVEADVVITFGGNDIIDGTFLFEAHGPKARYDRKDGTSIIFDGDSAWVTPASAEAPKGRFHVLTWPWFIMAPFKMAGDGINLSELSETEVDGVEYITLFQTFGADMGDTPDDWYRFYINPETQLIDAMAYIVTYGKDTETANAQASIIKYLNYEDEGGPVIARNYEFWYWDHEANAYEGDSPKGTGKVTAVSYPERTENPFAIPEDSRKLELPAANL